MSEIRPRESTEPLRRYAALRSSLIGYGVLAFTFFPPTRTLMAWGIGVQIAVIILGKVIERQVHDPARAGKALMLLELVADGVTVALFAVATLGGIMRFAEQV